MFLIIIIALGIYTVLIFSNKFRQPIALVCTVIMLLDAMINNIFPSFKLYEKFPIEVVIFMCAPCAVYLIAWAVYIFINFRELPKAHKQPPPLPPPPPPHGPGPHLVKLPPPPGPHPNNGQESKRKKEIKEVRKNGH